MTVNQECHLRESTLTQCCGLWLGAVSHSSCLALVQRQSQRPELNVKP
jgi:hypothetical protein